MIGLLAAVMLLWPSCYQPPVTAPIIDPFRAPACDYCAGNRGLEYQPAIGSVVRAAAAGTVTFSGVVAGIRYLVVEQADGRTATYGRLAVALVAPGSGVQPGEAIARTSARFYFGLRQGDHYVDPAPFLGVVRYRPRLIPVDGSPPRRPPPPVLRCAAAPSRWSRLVRRR